MLATERYFRMMWVQGPAGVGKSALAQSCVKEVGAKLAAAFFFSCSNAHDDPARLFASIAYQLTTRYPLYCDKLDEKIYRDSSLLQKPIDVQFQELIIGPFQELQGEGKWITEGVIFIDGLDECIGEDAQCTIIDVISASVRDQTTPFIWAFFSRPEPQIVAQFSAPHARSLCWQLNLPVSREADGEIKLYLQGAFENTRTQYDIPSTPKWPSDGDIQELVDRSVGSFVYPTSVIRYVNTGGALGPGERLQQVLRRPGELVSNPQAHLDAFYTLVMEQISKEMLSITLKLLLSFQVVQSQLPSVVATLLGLSMSAFSTALDELRSVLKLIRSDDGQPRDVRFYHASFKDFLTDPERSKGFYLRTPERCGALLGDIISFFDEGVDRGNNLLFTTEIRLMDRKSPVVIPWHDPRLADDMKRRLESAAFDIFWQLGSYAKFDEVLLQRLSEFDFRKLLYGWKIRQEDAERFFSNVSTGPAFARVRAMLTNCFRYRRAGRRLLCDHILQCSYECYFRKTNSLLVFPLL